MSSDPRQDLQTLRRVTERFSREHTLESILQDVTDAALALVPSGDHASIRLLDSSRRNLLSAARSGKGTQAQPLALGPGEGIAGWVLAHGEPLNVSDTLGEPRFVTAVGQGFKIRSILAEPLMAGGRAVGVISISSPDVDAFSDDDEQLARILANCSVPLLEKERLERLTLVDELTLAFQSHYLLKRLKEEMARAQTHGVPLSALAMDLDQLDRINVPFGRDVGDTILSLFAGRVRTACRTYDAFFRWGGDEFAIVLPATSPTQAQSTAEQLRAAVGDEPMEPRPGGRLTQTISIGVATWNGRETADELLERVWLGLQDAKAQGGNRVARAPVAA